MAVNKKATRKPSPRTKAASKPAVKPAAAPAAKAEAPKKGKGLLIVAVLALVLVAVGVQAYLTAKAKAAQNIEFLRVERIIDKGLGDGQAFGARDMASDKAGNFFQLDGQGDQFRLQKWDPSLNFVCKVKAAKGEEVMVDAYDMAVNSQGDVWVVQKNGMAKVYNNDLKYKKTLNLGVHDPSCIDFDSKDRAYVTSRSDNKVLVFDAEGRLQKEFGAPGTNSGDIASPVRVAVDTEDWVYVLENLGDKARIKAFGPDLKVRKEMLADKLNFNDYMFMGVDNENRLFFNDPAGNYGILIYNARKGKFVASGKSTKDNQSIINPGAVAVNKWTGKIFVNFIPGVMQVVMPAAK